MSQREVRRDRNPFGPLETVVSVLLAYLFLGLAGTALIAVASLALGEGTNVTVGTIGDRKACATVVNETAPATTEVSQRDLRRGVAAAHAEEVEICLSEPTRWQKTASALEPLGLLVFVLGSLLLVRRVIEGARRSGLFTEVTAARTRQLGWFLLVMTLVWPFVAAAGRGVVVEAAVRGGTWTGQLFHPGISVSLVVVSLGVLSVARVLRRAVPMQDELDATV
ncbi:DUF2975 domain-containing protein [Nocardioides lijunqiniae]|uniref:DUF2975 domain-containing protein n=1 Tax=Nocardioides lijunqiniae TaxID=2760832 RepID=UPI0018786572|nr:DUF2975 domain-containing protein [Nocardioides lijunqiniae]